MLLTHSQRFDVQQISHQVFAPLTHGCPSMTMAVDRAVFKKSPEEKLAVYTFKKQLGKTKHHKFISQMKGSF